MSIVWKLLLIQIVVCQTAAADDATVGGVYLHTPATPHGAGATPAAALGNTLVMEDTHIASSTTTRAVAPGLRATTSIAAVAAALESDTTPTSGAPPPPPPPPGLFAALPTGVWVLTGVFGAALGVFLGVLVLCIVRHVMRRRAALRLPRVAPRADVKDKAPHAVDKAPHTVAITLTPLPLASPAPAVPPHALSFQRTRSLAREARAPSPPAYSFLRSAQPAAPPPQYSVATHAAPSVYNVATHAAPSVWGTEHSGLTTCTCGTLTHTARSTQTGSTQHTAGPAGPSAAPRGPRPWEFYAINFSMDVDDPYTLHGDGAGREPDRAPHTAPHRHTHPYTLHGDGAGREGPYNAADDSAGSRTVGEAAWAGARDGQRVRVVTLDMLEESEPV